MKPIEFLIWQLKQWTYPNPVLLLGVHIDDSKQYEYTVSNGDMSECLAFIAQWIIYFVLSQAGLLMKSI